MSDYPEKPPYDMSKAGVNTRDLFAFLQDPEGFINRRTYIRNLGRDPGNVTISGFSGGPTVVSPNGSVNTESIVRLIGGNFISGRPLLPHIWNTQLDNGGLISVVDGELKIETNGLANGRARVQTLSSARFVTATYNFSHLAISIPNYLNTDVIRRWGCYDPLSVGAEDGIFIENNSGAYRVVRIKSGVEEESTLEADFNVSADPLDPTGPSPFVTDMNIHVYEIFYNAGTIWFLQDRKLFHKMTTPLSAAYSTPHLHAGTDCQNINGNIVNNAIVSRGFSISRFGQNTAIPQPFPIFVAGSYLIKNTPGRLDRILITKSGTGSANIKIYDGIDATGFLFADIDTSKVFGELDYNVEFNDGLFIVASGANVTLTAIFD